LEESDRALYRKANIQQPLLSPSLEVGAQNSSEQDGIYRDPKNLDEENDNDKIQTEGQPVIRTRQFEIDSLPVFSPPSMNSEH
jgi:hypothetical protein